MKESFRITENFIVEQNNRIYLPSIGWIRYINSREITGLIRSITVSQKCKKFFISVLSLSKNEMLKHPYEEIGIDLGVVQFAVNSNLKLTLFATHLAK